MSGGAGGRSITSEADSDRENEDGEEEDSD